MSSSTTYSLSGPGFAQRLGHFARVVFEPKLHTLFAAAWSLSLLGTLYAVADFERWPIGVDLAVLVSTVFGCLFFLRIVDEVKDYEYDRVHNPERPLVTGAVSRADVKAFATIVAGGVLSLNLAIAPELAVFVALDLGYGLLQLPLERKWPMVGSNTVLNLVAVYPVNIGLSIYTLLFFLERSGAEPALPQLLLVVAYACAFLHFELSRKTARPNLTEPGERLYSNVLGFAGAQLASTLFGLSAVGLAIFCIAGGHAGAPSSLWSYLPALALAPMFFGVVRQVRARKQRRNPRPLAVAYLLTFYGAMLAHALIATAPTWGLGR